MDILFKAGFKHVLTFGKHKGQTLSEVCSNDPSYIVWMHKNVKQLSLKNKVVVKALAEIADLSDTDSMYDPGDYADIF